MVRRLMITVDVEAFPARSSVDPLRRLIWGRFPEGSFGIGRMMSIADRHNVKLTMFLDYAEEFLYGDSLLDVAREIQARGHDPQLHVHPNFFSSEFIARHGIKPVRDLNVADWETSQIIFDFLCDRHGKATGTAPVAFRGGSYRFSGPMLRAMSAHGIEMNSTYNASRATRPIKWEAMPIFRWENGPLEIPISTVFDFMNANRHIDCNFNSYLFSSKDVAANVDRLTGFLDQYYTTQGDEAIAVLVMHSWSFLKLDEAGQFSTVDRGAVERFELLLERLSGRVEFVGSVDVCALSRSGLIPVHGPFRVEDTLADVVGRIKISRSIEVREAAADGIGEYDVSASIPARSAAPAKAPKMTRCAVCDEDLSALTKGEEGCPSCGSQARTRTIASLMESVGADDLPGSVKSKPMLAIAMTGNEEKLLRRNFNEFVSASLYGNYRAGHLENVDVRDLSRFSDGAFGSVFSCLLFDYFAEIEAALRECYRVLARGGVFMTHIAPYRLLADGSPPVIHGVMDVRPGYFGYVPKGKSLPSIKVGQSWFVEAMRSVGFETRTAEFLDEASGRSVLWFVGVKPGAGEGDSASEPRWGARVQAAFRRDGEKLVRSSVKANLVEVGRFDLPLPRDTGLKRLSLSAQLVDLGEEMPGARFAEHVIDRPSGNAQSEVVCLSGGRIGVSRDLGLTWELAQYPDLASKNFWNCMTKVDGKRLVQVYGWEGQSDSRGEGNSPGRIYLLDSACNVEGDVKCGGAAWHGSQSIDQVTNTICFGEYPSNLAKYRPDFSEKRREYAKELRSSAVFRSTDGGMHWTNVLEVSPFHSRHFHTVVADRFQAGVWWASTGDHAPECHIWRSNDDGQSWEEVTNPDPDVPMPPSGALKARSCQRHTSVAITSDRLIWGCDDIFGDRALFDPALPAAKRTGARLYESGKKGMLNPRELGYCGQPIRNIIDVNAGYILMSEAKVLYGGKLAPQVHFIAKAAPTCVVHVGDLPSDKATPTGFTYSRASVAAKDGVFFTYRGPRDFGEGSSRILRWKIDLE